MNSVFGIGGVEHRGFGNLVVEVFNVGGWLTHDGSALEINTDVLTVTKYRLVLSRAKKESCPGYNRRVSGPWLTRTHPTLVLLVLVLCHFAHFCHCAVPEVLRLLFYVFFPFVVVGYAFGGILWLTRC